MTSGGDEGGGLDRLPALVDADRGLVRRGRFLSATFLVEVGVPLPLAVR